MNCPCFPGLRNFPDVRLSVQKVGERWENRWISHPRWTSSPRFVLTPSRFPFATLLVQVILTAHLDDCSGLLMDPDVPSLAPLTFTLQTASITIFLEATLSRSLPFMAFLWLCWFVSSSPLYTGWSQIYLAHGSLCDLATINCSGLSTTCWAPLYTHKTNWPLVSSMPSFQAA